MTERGPSRIFERDCRALFSRRDGQRVNPRYNSENISRGCQGVSDILKPDLCIIGAGPAALEATAAAVAIGASVVLVLPQAPEDGALAAGAFIRAAEHARERRRIARAGFPEAAATLDFPALIRHVETVAEGLAANSAPERFTAMGATVIEGQGAFKDERSFAVGASTIQPRRFILAPPRLPILPEIEGLAALPVLTPDSFTTLERLPERMIQIGGDPEALALAQAFRRLGSQVVVLAPGTLLPDADPEMAGVLRRALAADGVTLREKAMVKRAERKLDGVSVLFETENGEERLDGSHILLGFGRMAGIQGLGVKAAGIALDGDAIATDDRLRTSNPRILCIQADSNHEGGLAVQNALLRAGKSLRHIQILHSIRTRPEIASVGLSEEQARKRHGKIEILRWPFSESRRARADDVAAGFVKVVATRKGLILGASIAGPRAGELIASWTVALTKRMTVQEMSQTVMPPFSLSESARQTALGYFSRRLSGLSLSLALKISRWLG